jgi:hypothetical protein
LARKIQAEEQEYFEKTGDYIPYTQENLIVLMRRIEAKPSEEAFVRTQMAQYDRVTATPTPRSTPRERNVPRKETCYLCRGRGKLERMCMRCTGSGWGDPIDGGRCANCGGTGKIEYSCYVCTGSGYVWK